MMKLNQRGSMMVLAMMAVLIVTVLAAIALRNARSAMGTVDGTVGTRQLDYLAEFAGVVGQEELNCRYQELLAQLEGSVTDRIVIDESTGVCGSEQEAFHDEILGNRVGEAGYRIELGEFTPAREVPGFDQDFCMLRVKIDALARVRQSATDEFPRERRGLGYVLVGPVSSTRCGG